MMVFDSCFGNFNKKNFKLNSPQKIMFIFGGVIYIMSSL